MKSFWLSLVLGALLAIGVTLGTSDFLAAYHGEAVGHRPVPGSDGFDDELRRFVLDQGSGWTEVVLPVSAFEDYSLPLAPFGVPPAERPENAPKVEKTRFSWSVRIDDRAVSLMGISNVFFGLLAGLVVVLGRNVLVAGNPFALRPPPSTGKKKKPKVGQAAAGRPAAPPRAARPQKGPPPRRGKGKRKGKRKRR